jgi:hypothetical protein
MKKLHSKLAVSSRQSAGKTNSFLPTAICQLLTISIFLLTANCLLPTSSNAMGTNAGTEILNTPTAVTLNYSNATGTGTVTRNSDNSVTSSVTAVYGLVPVLSNQNLSTEAGVSTNPNFVYTVTNNSNTNVTINASSGAFFYTGSAGTGGWSKSFADSVAENILNDAAFIFSFEVKPTINAYFGSTGSTTLNFYLDPEIPANRTGAYTGFNAINYGGSTTLSALTTTTVQAPDVVLLSRSVTAIAPTGLGYAGSTTDTVPGSQLSYTIVIKNIGNTASNTVNVIEKINNTSDVAYYYGNATTANFTIGFSTNTTVNYSVDGGLSFPYTNYDLAPKYSTTVDAIRWTLDSIPANGVATLNYRVVIRQN